MKKLGLGLTMVALFAVGCGGDDDDDDAAGGTTFEVDLTTEDEVPVCEGAGADATGDATVTISEDESEVSVELSWSDLSGPATAAHVHFGAVGAPGGVVFPLGMPPANPVTASFTASDYPSPPPDGAPADFAGFVTVMLAGTSYINVHSDACPPGEIRGQISD